MKSVIGMVEDQLEGITRRLEQGDEYVARVQTEWAEEREDLLGAQADYRDAIAALRSPEGVKT